MSYSASDFQDEIIGAVLDAKLLTRRQLRVDDEDGGERAGYLIAMKIAELAADHRTLRRVRRVINKGFK